MPQNSSKRRLTNREAALMQTADAIKRTAAAVERMIDIGRDMLPFDEEIERRARTTDGEAAANQAASVLNLAVIALESVLDVAEHNKSPKCKDGKPHTKECTKGMDTPTDKTYRMLISSGKPMMFETSSSGSDSDSDPETLEATLLTINPTTAICVPKATSSKVAKGSGQSNAPKRDEMHKESESIYARGAGKRNEIGIEGALCHMLFGSSKRQRPLPTKEDKTMEKDIDEGNKKKNDR